MRPINEETFLIPNILPFISVKVFLVCALPPLRAILIMVLHTFSIQAAATFPPCYVMGRVGMLGRKLDCEDVEDLEWL